MLELVAATAISGGLSIVATAGAAILGIGTLVALIFGVKWKASAQAAGATIELWRNNADGERARADSAAESEQRLITQLAELRQTLAELRALPDVATLAEMMRKQDDRADERHKSLIAAQEQLVQAIEKLSDRVMIREAAR